MRFFKTFFVKGFSLLVLLVIISNTSQAQPNLYFSLNDFFRKINSALYPSKFFNRQTNSLSESGSAIGVRRSPFVINSKTSNLENVKVQSTHPDIAYDPDNQRYLVVWEKKNDDGSSNILGQFRDKAGNSLNYPVLISTPRTKRGCFYETFDSDNSAITTPKNCPNASNPAVAYNKGSDGKGRFLVVWELKGIADFAKNSDGSSNSEGRKFSNIIVKMLNANDLTPAAHPDDKGSGGTGTDFVWEEGILISGIWIVSNNPAHPATNDSEIQAWEQSGKPDVAPSSSNGFLVTWQTNKGFIGCDDPARRDSTSVYARYIQPEFSPTNRALNKSSFPVYSDPTAALKASDTGACFALPNVFRAQKPRIAYNSMNKGTGSSDFVIAYEFARAASPSRGDIGAQRISLNTSNDGLVKNPTFTEYVVKGGDGGFLENPDIISYLDHVVLAYDDQHNISLKSIGLDLIELASVNLALGGNEGKVEPRLSSGFGISGNSAAGASDTIALSFINQNNFSAVLLDGMLNVLKGPVSISTTAQNSRLAELASDFSNFVVTWAGTANGVETVQAYKFLSSAKNNSPLTPELAASPANGVTWAPTRLYLHWNPANDPDGDKIAYEVYFSEVSSDPKVFPQAALYRSDVKDSKFVIQNSTDGNAAFAPNMGTTALYLQPNKSYAWRICSKDAQGAVSICTEPSRFNTDDSIVGWWRFDSDPNILCPAGLGKPTAPGGMPGNGVCDYSGNGNHGMLHGGISWLPPMTGILGRLFQFDGISGYSLMPDSSTLDGMNKLTIEAWVKTTAISTNKSILSKLGMVDSSYWMRVRVNGPGLVVGFSTKTLVVAESESNTLINDGKWHHIVGVYDGKLQKLYVDKVMESSTPQSGVISNNSVDVCIGAYCDKGAAFNGFFEGLIDETIIYSADLSEQSITNKNCADQALVGITPLPRYCNL